MVEHPTLQPRHLADVQFVNRLKRLHQAQEVESAVERADLAVGRDHGHGMRAELLRTDTESFNPKLGQLALPFEAGYQRRTLRRSHDYRAVAFNFLCGRNRTAEQARTTINEFAANGVEGRRVACHYDGSDARPVDFDRFLLKWIVAQPEAIAILGYYSNLQRDRHYEKTQPKTY